MIGTYTHPDCAAVSISLIGGRNVVNIHHSLGAFPFKPSSIQAAEKAAKAWGFNLVSFDASADLSHRTANAVWNAWDVKIPSSSPAGWVKR